MPKEADIRNFVNLLQEIRNRNLHINLISFKAVAKTLGIPESKIKLFQKEFFQIATMSNKLRSYTERSLLNEIRVRTAEKEGIALIEAAKVEALRLKKKAQRKNGEEDEKEFQGLVRFYTEEDEKEFQVTI